MREAHTSREPAVTRILTEAVTVASPVLYHPFASIVGIVTNVVTM